jgi:hypothetical protein
MSDLVVPMAGGRRTGGGVKQYTVVIDCNIQCRDNFQRFLPSGAVRYLGEGMMIRSLC